MKTLHYKVLGLTSLTMGLIGAILPLIPTTCFVLLAGWCFAKSSPKWHQQLLHSPLFGDILKQWEERRCITVKARRIAIASMLLSGAFSVAIIDSPPLKVLVIILLSAGIYPLTRISACQLSYKR